MNNIKKVVIYSNDNIYELPLYEEIKKYKFELIQVFDEYEFINSDINLKIINSNVGYEKTLGIIKRIRKIKSKKQVCVIVGIEIKNIDNLLSYIEVGANDYIKIPYKTLELKTILTNNLNVLDEDTKFQLTIDTLPFPIWVTDIDGKYTDANIYFAQNFNVDVEGIIGKHPNDFYEQDEVDKIHKENMKVLKEKETFKFNGKYISEGKVKIAEVYKKPVYNANNQIIGIIGTIVDITELKDAKDEIKNNL